MFTVQTDVSGGSSVICWLSCIAGFPAPTRMITWSQTDGCTWVNRAKKQSVTEVCPLLVSIIILNLSGILHAALDMTGRVFSLKRRRCTATTKFICGVVLTAGSPKALWDTTRLLPLRSVRNSWVQPQAWTQSDSVTKVVLSLSPKKKKGSDATRP